MASTNKTSNLNLSQFIATDTPTWLVDYNGDMEKIDAGVGRVEELAQTASTQAVGVASGLQATNQTVTTLSGQVANVQNQANTTTASVNGINQRLGNANISGIGDGTITGAISAQNINLNLIDVSENITGENITPFYMYKNGRIVYFSVNVLGVTITANSGVSRPFISGNYPKQLTAISVFATKNNTPTNVLAAIDTNGSLVLRSNTTVSGDYVVSGFYVSE